jgi:hypothetical protein
MLKKMLKLLYLSGVIISLFSCMTIDIIVGNWADKKNWIELNLNEDSTYVYYLSNRDQTRNYSEGKWTVNGKKIIINSSIQNTIVPLEISYEKMKSNEKQICISSVLRVVNPYQYANYNETDYVCEPFTNDTTPLRQQLTAQEIFKCLETNTDIYHGRRGSYTLYSDTLIHNIRFIINRGFFTGFHVVEQPIYTEIKNLKCSLGDSIIINININDDLFNYKVFTNEILNVKNNNIIFYNDNKKKFRLKKQNDNTW